jgi:hypothetical protein
MNDRGGVRKGQRVRDVEGKSLGRVGRLFEATFEVKKGFPLLFADNRVLRYDEVRLSEGGELVVSRATDDLFTLAAGRLPDSWKVGTAQGFPSAATPSEAARLLGRGLARGGK